MYLFNQSDIAIAAILTYYALTNNDYVTVSHYLCQNNWVRKLNQKLMLHKYTVCIIVMKVCDDNSKLKHCNMSN